MPVGELFVLLEQSPVAAYLRASRWGYAALSAAHIFGIALIVGATLPLNLRLVGRWSTIARQVVARLLVPIAATGLVLALVTGLLLFSVRATEYSNLTIFWAKMAAVTVGGLSAIAAHIRHGLYFQNSNRPVLWEVAAVSFLAWIAALLAGRLIAFAG